jgi:hypothetical protein
MISTIYSVEQNSGRLFLRRLFNVPIEASVADKTWINDKTPTRLKDVGNSMTQV